MGRKIPMQLPRGRPRSFDTEAAVERAMGVFWSAAIAPRRYRSFFVRRSSRVVAFTLLSVTSARSSCLRLIATLPMR